jgi:hypothetical protein
MRTQHSPLPILASLGLVGVLLLGGDRAGYSGDEQADARSWSWERKPAPDEIAPPTMEICPLKYDKEWAYAVEIDDGPASTLTVAQPLLARFAFTDAPPGVAGGRALPFVGGAAVMVHWVGTSNDTHLNWEQIRELERKGWGVLNHSYWHSGNHWDPAQALKPADFRRELYWSRALLAGPPWDGPGDAHFVYPNGDYNFRPFLAEFGIRSASRVGGTCRTLLADAEAFRDLDRNYLDESVWAKSGDPLLGFPKVGPKRGDLVIDFTHGIEPGSDSANQRRWIARLSNIAARFGRSGADTIWCAPTTDVIDYTLTARVATLEASQGRLTVQLPDSAPGSALTLKLTGVSERSRLDAPPGGRLYRKGNQAWITTPRIGRRGAAMPKPPLKLLYQGPVKDVTLDRPHAVAGVRLMQEGGAAPLRIELVKPDGSAEPLVSDERARVKPQWGCWLLFPTVPDRPAVIAREVRVAPDPALKRMEIWVLTD